MVNNQLNFTKFYQIDIITLVQYDFFLIKEIEINESPSI